ncbi:hypothetical protein IMSAG049_01371 [Clostridiales bacterium]|nr:hypothetical protein IMSAG049_01371 [Clostridiales bacterium]
MGIKYILAVFLAAAFFMTGCSSNADNSGIDDGLMNDGNYGTTRNYDSTGGFDPTFGTGLNGNGSYDLTGLPSDSSARDYIRNGNNGYNGTNSNGSITGNNGGMASTTNTGTNY